MPEPYDKTLFSPWGLFRGNDIYWLGMARDEQAAWVIGLGWPDESELAAAKSAGIYAAPVGLTKRKK
jgi:hypothetical protein